MSHHGSLLLRVPVVAVVHVTFDVFAMPDVWLASTGGMNAFGKLSRPTCGQISDGHHSSSSMEGVRMYQVVCGIVLDLLSKGECCEKSDHALRDPVETQNGTSDRP